MADTFGMSDMWSTMAGECGQGEGLHLTTGGNAIIEVVDPASGEPIAPEDGARGELVWTHLRREASPLLRYRSGDLATVWTAPCACGRTTPRIRIDGRTDDMLRVRAVNIHPGAIGAVLDGFPGLGRHAVVADGDPIAPPLRVYVEAAASADPDAVAEGAAPPAARTLPGRRARAGDAARRGAQDPHRVPDRPRRRAAARDRQRPTDKEPEPVTVTAEPLGSARVVRWEQAGRLNAWTRETIEAIADAIEAAGADEGVRSIVVRGAGEHFSAGDDLHAALVASADDWAATIAAFQRVTRVTFAAPVPVLAAIDGVCIGGALEFAASCDLRIATDRARFATPEVGIGLVATNAGTLLLPEILGETAARELLLTGALRDPNWALRHHFVSEIVAPGALDERIAAWTSGFDAVSRTAVARTKAMLNARLGDLVAQAMDREERACVELFDGTDAREALEAFANRRR